jgi:hypothetical protein
MGDNKLVGVTEVEPTTPSPSAKDGRYQSEYD